MIEWFDIVDENTYTLIDADIVLYRVCYSIQTDFKDNVETAPVDAVYDKTDNLLAEIVDNCPAANVWLYLTSRDKSNFRYADAFTQPYKGNRAKTEKPFWLDTIYDYIRSEWDAQVVYGREADDELGVQASVAGRKCTVATTDKDLNMLLDAVIYDITKKTLTQPGSYLKLNDKKKLHGRGMPWFWAQMLLGDSVDNILKPVKGRGYGDVGIYEKLQDCRTDQDYFEVVWSIYRDNLPNGLERFMENARLLWMCTTQIEDIREYLESNYEFI